MRIVSYEKTNQGPIVTEVRDEDTSPKPSTSINRFKEFFHDVPFRGGSEWETLTTDEIASIFREAAEDIRQVWLQYRETAAQEYASHNILVRLWKNLLGWRIPTVPSKEEILRGMVTRCENLSSWALANHSRTFYAGYDMDHFINKPKEVAKLLAAK